MGYVRGLARIALAAGARISTGIHVEKLSREDGLWQVQFGEQILRAKSVILATNAYTDNLWPGLKQTFTKINYFNIATTPINEKLYSILPEGMDFGIQEKLCFPYEKIFMADSS